jgi:spore maturation protein CgeB
MSRPLHIAFFASSLLSAYWNGAATYYRGILAALARRGHRITFFEPDAFERQQHRDIDPPDWAEVVVYPAELVHVERCLARAAAEADILVKASGVGVFDAELERGVLTARRPTSAVVFWDVDAPATLDRVHADERDGFRDLIPLYDAVLTYGGGPPVVEAYRSLAARECIPVYNALDPSTHHAVQPRAEFAADLAFLGNRLPDRESRVESFFLAPAAALPDRSFLLGGSGWDDKPCTANVRVLGHVYTADHNAFNCSPGAVLNISRDSMARYGFSPATRVFEAAGAAACIITDAWRGIDHFLAVDREILVAESGDDVVRLLASVGAERATAIGAAARKRVLAEHTYEHRAAEVDEILCSLLEERRAHA